MTQPDFATRLATTPQDRRAAARLRYEVFIEELGGTGPGVDHAARIESDDFDDASDHLVLLDRAREGAPVVGLYRLLDRDGADRAGRFYTETEYDLAPLRASGRTLLELGRSCLHPAYRGGMAMFHLWSALAVEVAKRNTDILFGVASFHGTDPQALALPLSHLHHTHLSPPDLRVRSRVFQRMDLLAQDRIDLRRAMVETPALIKAYLRLGGTVGEGAFVDHAFNTTDVFMLMDTARMNHRTAAIYRRGQTKADS